MKQEFMYKKKLVNTKNLGFDRFEYILKFGNKYWETFLNEEEAIKEAYILRDKANKRFEQTNNKEFKKVVCVVKKPIYETDKTYNVTYRDRFNNVAYLKTVEKEKRNTKEIKIKVIKWTKT